MPSNTDGLGSRTHVLLAVPDVVWNQTLAFSWNYSQGDLSHIVALIIVQNLVFSVSVCNLLQ